MLLFWSYWFFFFTSFPHLDQSNSPQLLTHSHIKDGRWGQSEGEESQSMYRSEACIKTAWCIEQQDRKATQIPRTLALEQADMSKHQPTKKKKKKKKNPKTLVLPMYFPPKAAIYMVILAMSNYELLWAGWLWSPKNRDSDGLQDLSRGELPYYKVLKTWNLCTTADIYKL